MNVNNLAQKVNVICGSPELDWMPYFVQSFVLPGMMFNLPEVGGRAGTRNLLASDTILYNQFSFTILVDETYESYFEFMDKVFKAINVEKDKFDNNVTFSFFIVMTNNKGIPLFRYDLYNCRVESVGDILIDLNNDEPLNTFDVSFRYEYFTCDRNSQRLSEFLNKLKSSNRVEQHENLISKSI